MSEVGASRPLMASEGRARVRVLVMYYCFFLKRKTPPVAEFSWLID